MYRWDHDIWPVFTVDRIRYLQNHLLLCQKGEGGGGIQALLTAPGLDRIPVFAEEIGGRFGQNTL